MASDLGSDALGVIPCGVELYSHLSTLNFRPSNLSSTRLTKEVHKANVETSYYGVSEAGETLLVLVLLVRTVRPYQSS